MAKQIDNWFHGPNTSINLRHCSVYYRSAMTARAWKSLYCALAKTQAFQMLQGSEKAQAIIIVSTNLILAV